MEAGGRPDALGELISPGWMQDAMTKVVEKGIGHITKVCVRHFSNLRLAILVTSGRKGGGVYLRSLNEVSFPHS